MSADELLKALNVPVVLDKAHYKDPERGWLLIAKRNGSMMELTDEGQAIAASMPAEKPKRGRKRAAADSVFEQVDY